MLSPEGALSAPRPPGIWLSRLETGERLGLWGWGGRREPRSGRRSGADAVQTRCGTHAGRVRCGAVRVAHQYEARAEEVQGTGWVAVRFGARGVRVRGKDRCSALGAGAGRRGRGAGRGGAALARRGERIAPRCLLPPAPLILFKQNLADSGARSSWMFQVTNPALRSAIRALIASMRVF